MSSNPYQSPYGQSPYGQFTDKPVPQASPPPKHSGLGIGSFIMAILSGIEIFVMIAVATYFAAQNPDQFNEESPQAIIVGLGIFAGMGLAVIGLGLGIAGLAQPNRIKLFAILGLVFNVLLFVGVCGIIGLGLAVG
jgi:mannose/fructose/N-acetylgalactosamine-specific phosphotransferase system component IIC